MARELGAEVEHLHAAGRGIPDLLVAFRGVWFLVEVKTVDGSLSDSQVEWHEKFSRQAPIYVWRSCDDAVNTLLYGWTPEEVQRDGSCAYDETR